jgi:hypothetical protein
VVWRVTEDDSPGEMKDAAEKAMIEFGRLAAAQGGMQ